VARRELRGQLLGRDVGTGERRDAERGHVLAHEERAGLPAVIDDDAGDAVTPATLHPARPDVARLDDVRIRGHEPEVAHRPTFPRRRPGRPGPLTLSASIA